MAGPKALTDFPGNYTVVPFQTDCGFCIVEHAAKLEDFISNLNTEIDGLESKRSKLDADIARLEEEKVKKSNEVGEIVPKATAEGRKIIEDAQSKAAKIISDAATSAAKMKADADAYNARVIARVSKIKEELS